MKRFYSLQAAHVKSEMDVPFAGVVVICIKWEKIALFTSPTYDMWKGFVVYMPQSETVNGCATFIAHL